MGWKQYICCTDIIARICLSKNWCKIEKTIIECERIVKYEILLPSDSLVHAVRCRAPSTIQTDFVRVTSGSEVRVFHILLGLPSHSPLVHARCVARFIIYFNARRIHEYFIDFTDSYLLVIRILVYRSMCICELMFFSFSLLKWTRARICMRTRNRIDGKRFSLRHSDCMMALLARSSHAAAASRPFGN